MSVEDKALRAVINHLTEYVRDHDQALGAQLGAQLAREFPEFDFRHRGFVSLTDLLERAAPELSIVGRSGQDYVWSTHADLGLMDSGLDPTNEDSISQSPQLTRFRARGFKSLANLDVPLRSFNVLVGANGAGKTSILEGLFLLSQFRYKKPAVIFSGSRQLNRLATIGEHTSVKLRFEVGTDGEQFVEYEGEARPDEPDIHLLRINDGEQTYEHNYTRNEIAEKSPRLIPLLRAFGGTTLLRLDARRLAKPSFSTREQPTLRYDGFGLSSVLANLAATDPDCLDRIVGATQEIIPAFGGTRMPRQKIWHNSTDEIGNGLELQLYDKWLDATLASEGTLLVLGLMTIIHGLDSSRLLLMDDIERALHPKAQRVLAEKLGEVSRSSLGLQLVCTTHSPYLLDAVDPEDVQVVRASPKTGLSRCRRLVEHEAWEKWRRSMSPGEFWTYVGEDWLESE